MLQRIFHIAFYGLAMLAVAAIAVHAQPVGPSQPVLLQHADKFTGSIDASSGGNIVEAIGNVVLYQGVVKIEADRATLYEARNVVVLVGNVRVTQPEFVLTAPRVEYNGNTRLAVSPNGVTIVDRGATLRAGHGEYNMYDRRARFRNGVSMHDEKSTLNASMGEYFSLERKAIFGGGVKVVNDSGTITARDLTYWRDTRQAFAVGNVVVATPEGNSWLTGDTVQHRPDEGYAVATGRPKLVRIDTAGTADSLGNIHRDTTIITAMKMQSFRGDYTEYVATDSVRLVRGNLEAMARRARFLPDDNLITLGPNRAPVADSTADSGSTSRDSLPPRPDSPAVTGVPSPAVTGGKPLPYGIAPVVWFDNSQLTGDSIVVRLQEKRLRGINVLGNGFAVSQGKRPNRYDQLAALQLLFDIERDTIRSVHADGEASSIYYLQDSDRPNGVNRASGDTIVITFRDGQAKRTRIMGRRSRAEGEYFPEKLLRGQEEQFRLQGFRWYGRDKMLENMNPALPRAPAIQEVKPDAGSALGTGTTSRPRTP